MPISVAARNAPPPARSTAADARRAEASRNEAVTRSLSADKAALARSLEADRRHSDAELEGRLQRRVALAQAQRQQLEDRQRRVLSGRAARGLLASPPPDSASVQLLGSAATAATASPGAAGTPGSARRAAPCQPFLPHSTTPSSSCRRGRRAAPAAAASPGRRLFSSTSPASARRHASPRGAAPAPPPYAVGAAAPPLQASGKRRVPSPLLRRAGSVEASAAPVASGKARRDHTGFLPSSREDAAAAAAARGGAFRSPSPVSAGAVAAGADVRALRRLQQAAVRGELDAQCRARRERQQQSQQRSRSCPLHFTPVGLVRTDGWPLRLEAATRRAYVGGAVAAAPAAEASPFPAGRRHYAQASRGPASEERQRAQLRRDGAAAAATRSGSNLGGCLVDVAGRSTPAVGVRRVQAPRGRAGCAATPGAARARRPNTTSPPRAARRSCSYSWANRPTRPW